MRVYVGNGERLWEMFTSFGCVVGLWSTTHTSGGGGCGATAPASVINTHQRFVYMQMQRVHMYYTTEVTKHCYTAEITLCSQVGDCHTPLSQDHV